MFNPESRLLEDWPLIELVEATEEVPGRLRLGIPQLTSSQYARAREELRTMLDLAEPRSLVRYAQQHPLFLALAGRSS